MKQSNEIIEILQDIKNNFFTNKTNWSNYIKTLKEVAIQNPTILREVLKYDFQLSPYTIEDYRKILINKLGKEGNNIIEELIQLSKILKGKKIVLFSATFNGGGVAEMIQSAGGILKHLGIELEWHIIYPYDSEFYNITKAIHNTIQGKETDIPPRYFAIWEQVNQDNVEIFKSVFQDPSVIRVFFEDPQVVPMIHFAKQKYNFSLNWRLHIDIRGINKKNPMAIKIWNHILLYLMRLNLKDSVVFQPYHIPQILPDSKILTIAPGIDPFKNKNKELSWTDATNIIKNFINQDINLNIPTIVTGARFDYWKGLPLILRSFENIANQYQDINLLIFGNYADDDPEGIEHYQLLKYMVDNSQFKNRINLICNFNDELCALYKFAAQHEMPFCACSLAEGYCLMTNEASIHGAVPLTTNVGGLQRYKDEFWSIDIAKQASQLNDASELYKLIDGNLIINDNAIAFEEIITNKLNNIFNYRKQETLYHEYYQQALFQAEYLTYQHSLITMLIEYLKIALGKEINQLHAK